MILLLMLLVSPLLLPAQVLTGHVVRVIDGDTISVLLNGTPTTLRLNGIDCPEIRQPFGLEAKQFTTTLSFSKIVTIVEKGSDRYGRMLADITLPDGKSLNRELVKAGMAWWYRKYVPSDWLLKGLEANARQAGRGLWARDSHSVPPWEWRRPANRQELQ